MNGIPKIYIIKLEKRSTFMPVKEAARVKNLTKLCRVWQGATDQGGYGVMRIEPGLMGIPSGLVRIHRLSYWYHFGPFLEALEVDHECRRKGCWEPEHLFLRGPIEHAKLSNKDKYAGR